jgi:hypothetical protein
MKPKPLVELTTKEVESGVKKGETIQLRLTEVEKEEIRDTARSVHLSVTEYLLNCHAVVARKLRSS